MGRRSIRVSDTAFAIKISSHSGHKKVNRFIGTSDLCKDDHGETWCRKGGGGGGGGEASQGSYYRSDRENSVDLFLFKDCKVYERLVLKGCYRAIKVAVTELRSVFYLGMMAGCE